MTLETRCLSGNRATDTPATAATTTVAAAPAVTTTKCYSSICHTNQKLHWTTQGAAAGMHRAGSERANKQCNFGWGIAIPLGVRERHWARKSSA